MKAVSLEELANDNNKRAALRFQNAALREGGIYLRCDNIGCNETHPIDHEDLGQPEFEFGRWMGWMYLDLNREDLFGRAFRFCSTLCLADWLDAQIVGRGKRPLSALDRALREPGNEVVRRAVLNGDVAATHGTAAEVDDDA